MMMGKVVGRNKDWYVIHPRAPSDLHWQSQIRWVINEANDDDDETDDDENTDDNNTDNNDANDDDDNTDVIIYESNFSQFLELCISTVPSQHLIYVGGVDGGSPLRVEYWSSIRRQKRLYQETLC